MRTQPDGLSPTESPGQGSRNIHIDTYNRENQSKENHNELVREIDKLNDRVKKARELLLAGDIDGTDYKLIKSESETTIERLEVRLSEALRSKRAYVNIEPIVNGAIQRLTNINSTCCQSNTYDKRSIIGSMYPEKFTFEELQHRTAKAGEFYSFIWLINSELDKRKRRASDRLTCLPTLAPKAGLEPATL